MFITDPHLVAAFSACSSACEIVDLLPQSDLTVELADLLEVQFDLFCHILEGKHYGSDNLTDFLAFAEEVKEEINRIKREAY